jgi:hypothetical protein
MPIRIMQHNHRSLHITTDDAAAIPSLRVMIDQGESPILCLLAGSLMQFGHLNLSSTDGQRGAGMSDAVVPYEVM